MTVDREKVDDALDVTKPSESAVYEIDASEYVRRPMSMKNAKKRGCKS